MENKEKEYDMFADDTNNAKEDKGAQENIFTFPEDGKKPIVDNYGDHKYHFMPGDEVYIRPSGECPREGPYVIEKAESGKYTLCDLEGKRAKEGQTFGEQALEERDPFE